MSAATKYLTDDVLREVARVYSAALALGDYPVKAVENECGIPRTTARKRVEAARRRGFLPPTTPGVPR